MSKSRRETDQRIVLLPDSGPLITLAYADALDLLFEPEWPLALVDMVLLEVTRNETPTSHLDAASLNCVSTIARFGPPLGRKPFEVMPDF